jgi:hypothetical protein
MPSTRSRTPAPASVPDGCNGEIQRGALVHSNGTCIRHNSLPYRLAAFAATLADEYGWPADELLQSAVPYSKEAETSHQTHSNGREAPSGALHLYVVRTANGERQWHAEDANHAREQHTEAHGGQPGEAITGVRRVEH